MFPEQMYESPLTPPCFFEGSMTNVLLNYGHHSYIRNSKEKLWLVIYYHDVPVLFRVIILILEVYHIDYQPESYAPLCPLCDLYSY